MKPAQKYLAHPVRFEMDLVAGRWQKAAKRDGNIEKISSIRNQIAKERGWENWPAMEAALCKTSHQTGHSGTDMEFALHERLGLSDAFNQAHLIEMLMRRISNFAIHMHKDLSREYLPAIVPVIFAWHKSFDTVPNIDAIVLAASIEDPFALVSALEVSGRVSDADTQALWDFATRIPGFSLRSCKEGSRTSKTVIQRLSLGRIALLRTLWNLVHDARMQGSKPAQAI